MLGIICQDEWQEKYAKEPGELGELKNGLRSEDSLENWRDIRTEGKRKETWKLKRDIRIEGHHEKGPKILDYIAKYAVRRYSMCFKTMWLSEERLRRGGRRSCLWRTWKLSKCLFDFSRFTGTRSNSLAAFLVSPFNRLTAPCHRKVHRKLLNESLSASLQFGSFLFWSFSARSSCNFYGRFFQFSWGVF